MRNKENLMPETESSSSAEAEAVSPVSAHEQQLQIAEDYLNSLSGEKWDEILTNEQGNMNMDNTVQKTPSGSIVIPPVQSPAQADANYMNWIMDNQMPTVSDYLAWKYKEGEIPLVRGAFGAEGMYGQIPIEEALEKGNRAYLEQLEEMGKMREITFTEAPVLKMLGEATGLLPFMLASIKHGLEMGLVFGGGYAGFAAWAGQIPPLTLVPEEALTVPTAFATGMGQGMAFGVIKTSLDIEGGNLFLDLIEKGVDKKTATPLAIGAGLAIGLIEVSQLKLFTAPIKLAFTKMIKKGTAKNAISKVLKSYFKTIGVQMGQEQLQEIIQIATKLLAGHIENNPDVAPTYEEIGKQLLETAKITGQALPVLGLPGAVASSFIATKRSQKEITDEEKGEKISESKQKKKETKPSESERTEKSVSEDKDSIKEKQEQEVIAKEKALVRKIFDNIKTKSDLEKNLYIQDLLGLTEEQARDFLLTTSLQEHQEPPTFTQEEIDELDKQYDAMLSELSDEDFEKYDADMEKEYDLVYGEGAKQAFEDSMKDKEEIRRDHIKALAERAAKAKEILNSEGLLTAWNYYKQILRSPGMRLNHKALKDLATNPTADKLIAFLVATVEQTGNITKEQGRILRELMNFIEETDPDLISKISDTSKPKTMQEIDNWDLIVDEFESKVTDQEQLKEAEREEMLPEDMAIPEERKNFMKLVDHLFKNIDITQTPEDILWNAISKVFYPGDMNTLSDKELINQTLQESIVLTRGLDFLEKNLGITKEELTELEAIIKTKLMTHYGDALKDKTINLQAEAITDDLMETLETTEEKQDFLEEPDAFVDWEADQFERRWEKSIEDRETINSTTPEELAKASGMSISAAEDFLTRVREAYKEFTEYWETERKSETDEQAEFKEVGKRLEEKVNNYIELLDALLDGATDFMTALALNKNIKTSPAFMNRIRQELIRLKHSSIHATPFLTLMHHGEFFIIDNISTLTSTTPEIIAIGATEAEVFDNIYKTFIKKPKKADIDQVLKESLNLSEEQINELSDKQKEALLRVNEIGREKLLRTYHEEKEFRQSLEGSVTEEETTEEEATTEEEPLKEENPSDVYKKKTDYHNPDKITNEQARILWDNVDTIIKDIKEGSKKLINDIIDNNGNGFSSAIKKAFYNFKKKFFALQPMDIIFDLLDTGKSFKGINYTLFKKPMNIAYANMGEHLGAIMDEIYTLHYELQLDETNYKKILVYAVLEQDAYYKNEIGREKLLRTYSKEELATFEKEGLTAEEKQMLDLMRKHFDIIKPQLAEVMKKVYNKEFGAREYYFSMMTDFDAMEQWEIDKYFGDEAAVFEHLNTVSASFLKERKGGAVPIKTNAFQVFQRHMENATYLIHMAEIIEKSLAIARTNDYKDAVGEAGQTAVLDWLNLLARKGGAGSSRIRALDWLRENASVAILGYKLSTILIQPTALLDGAALLQTKDGNYAFKGLYAILMSPQASAWRTFIKHNSTEIKKRTADDPAFAAFLDNELDKSWFGEFKKHAFWGVRAVDSITAIAVFAGAYMKILAEKGKTVDLTTIDIDAIHEAELYVRRTQASAQSIDLPAAVSQGGLTGNVSIDKAITQFQTFIFTRASIVVQSIGKNGAKNTPEMRNIAGFLTIALIAEVVIRRSAQEMIGMLTGDDPDEPFIDTFLSNFGQELFSSIPILGQIGGAYKYDSPPIPVLSLAEKAISNSFVYMSAEDKKEAKIYLVRSLLEFAGLFGIAPGANQADQILRDFHKIQKRKENTK